MFTAQDICNSMSKVKGEKQITFILNILSYFRQDHYRK